LVTIIEDDRLEDAIEFARDNLNDAGEVTLPAIDKSGNY
jgi:hypothetical protein